MADTNTTATLALDSERLQAAGLLFHRVGFSLQSLSELFSLAIENLNPDDPRAAAAMHAGMVMAHHEAETRSEAARALLGRLGGSDPHLDENGGPRGRLVRVLRGEAGED